MFQFFKKLYYTQTLFYFMGILLVKVMIALLQEAFKDENNYKFIFLSIVVYL